MNNPQRYTLDEFLDIVRIIGNATEFARRLETLAKLEELQARLNAERVSLAQREAMVERQMSEVTGRTISVNQKLEDIEQRERTLTKESETLANRVRQADQRDAEFQKKAAVFKHAVDAVR